MGVTASILTVVRIGLKRPLCAPAFDYMGACLEAVALKSVMRVYA